MNKFCKIITVISIVSFILVSCNLATKKDTPDNPEIPNDPTLPGANMEVIYDETVNSNFGNTTWGSADLDLAADNNPCSGDVCLSLAGTPPTVWGDSIAFVGHDSYHDMSSAKFKYLTFMFNHGSSTADDIDVSLKIMLDDYATTDYEVVPLSDYLPSDTSANTWYRISIPISDVNPNNLSFAQIIFYNNGNTNFQYYLDNIFLEWIDDTADPVISDIAEDSTYNSIVISWTTDEAADSVINYGLSEGSLTDTVSSDSYGTSHELTIPGLEKLTEYFYRITTTDPAGNSTSSAVRSVETTDIPVTGDITFAIDATVTPTVISPFIYGMNGAPNNGLDEVPYTYTRMGGNRWTAYNWETNASNAGSDWYYHNDGLISDLENTAIGVTDTIQTMFSHNSAALVTIPIEGHVSSDKAGVNVMYENNHLEDCFHESYAYKTDIYPGSSLSLTPDKTDDYVFQDEFVNYLNNEFASQINIDEGRTIFFDMDNEPALWASTHREIRNEHEFDSWFDYDNSSWAEREAYYDTFDVNTSKVTYQELVDKNIEYGKAVKSIMPDAKVFGFVAYGYAAYTNLQDASDASGNFVEYFLSEMAAAETANGGNRIVDAIDLHWYPEAYGADTNGSSTYRITTERTTPEMVEARIQAPRSLWDPTYTENSWIAKYMTSGPVMLIPDIKAKIAANYPGTEYVISEYYYGAGDHISGGLAQADVLGVFGREGIYAASLWPSSKSSETFIKAAFRMYLNYDGSSSFGDRGIGALSDNNEQASVFASLDSEDPDRMVIIAINKTDGVLQADFDLTITGGNYTQAKIYQINSSAPVINSLPDVTISSEDFSYDLDPYTITLLELNR